MRAPAAALAALLVAAACGSGAGSGAGSGSGAGASPVQNAVPPTPSPEAQVVYAAIGASETVGVGTDDPRSQAWPQLFFRTLPRSAVYYNFGVSGSTTAAALTQQLPQALPVRPTLVTVWLNVDDLLAGVAPADYEDQLGRLVHALRRDGSARVLMANTPWLDHLPAYYACRPNPPAGAPRCLIGSRQLPDPDQLNSLVDAYNAAIGRVALREGATVVDLHAAGEVADLHPEWVSRDGFHPSAAGAAQIAATFATALNAQTGQPR